MYKTKLAYRPRLGLIGTGKSNQAILTRAHELYEMVSYSTSDPNSDLHAIDQVDIMCISPGIDIKRVTDPIIKQLALHKDLVNDIELFFRHFSPKVIAVTGSFGKSTVVANISHKLTELGIANQTLGNIGQPIWEWDCKSVIVLELSSYQLELLESLKAKVGIVLNIFPHHLQRHGDIETYRGLKMKLLDLCEKSVLCPTDPIEEAIQCFLEDEAELKEKNRSLINNAQSKYTYQAYSSIIGKRNSCLEKVTASSNKVPAVKLSHRMETIATNIINDSKSTSPFTLNFALNTIQAQLPVLLICGGKFDSTASWDIEWRKADRIIIFGDAHDKIPCPVTCTRIRSLYDLDLSYLVGRYFILFSPGCQSFDEFDSFEHRGNVFKKIVSKYIDLSIY